MKRPSPRMRRVPHIAALLGAALVGLACGSDRDSPPSRPVRFDLRSACEWRQSAPKPPSSDCNRCRSFAILTPCECSPELGGCYAEKQVRASETECDAALDTCIAQCSDDCACLDACYEGRARCRDASNSLEDCVTQLCEPRCS